MSIQEFTSYPAVRLSRLLITLENGSRPVGGVGLITDGVPSLGGEHIANNGQFNFENIKYVPNEFFARMSRGIIQKNDVLIVKDGATTGKTSFVGEDFPYERAAVNEHVFIARPDPELLLSEFLFHFLYSEWGQAQMEREYHGGAIGGINQSFSEQLEIPLPPLPEQHRITGIIRQANLIKQLRKDTILRSKKLHAKLFEWYFGNGETKGDHKTVRLESLLKVGLASGYSPPTNDDLSGIPVFNLSALTDYGLDEKQLKYFPAKSYNEKGSDLAVDDLLISRSNTLEFVGRVGRYKGSLSKVIYPDTMIRIRVGDHVDAIYLEHFLRSPYMRAVITQRARGTSGSMKKISQSDIKEFQVVLPRKSERVSFAQKIECLEEQENKFVIAFQKIDFLCQSISTHAFTGELTTPWRKTNKEELQRAAVERDKKLELRGEAATMRDAAEDRLTPEEEEQLRQALGQFAVNITNMLEPVRQSMLETMGALIDMNTIIFEPVLQSIRQNLEAISVNLIPGIPSVDHETVMRHIDALPVPQAKRAVTESFDKTTLRVLKLAGTYPAYFTAEDLETGKFGGITILQAEASLRVLQALGFVKLVRVDGFLRYRLTEASDFAEQNANSQS